MGSHTAESAVKCLYTTVRRYIHPVCESLGLTQCVGELA